MTRAPLAGTAPGAPEAMFGLSPLTVDPRGEVEATMPTGPWLGDAERGAVAGLGVLVDDTLGYAGVAATTGWFLTTELSVDLAGPIPVDGRTLSCRARVLQRDRQGALLSGTVHDDRDGLVALCAVRGRFIEAGPGRDAAGPSDATGSAPDRPTRIEELLAPELRATAGEATLHVSDRVVNPLGRLHGGLAFGALEHVATTASTSGWHTTSVRAQLVRGAPRGERLTFAARTLHRGRTLEVVAVTSHDGTGRLTGSATVTRSPHAPGHA